LPPIIFAGTAVLLIVCLETGPLLGILLAVMRGEFDLSGIHMLDVYREAGTVSILARTMRIALFTALLTAVIAYMIGRVLCDAPRNLTVAWIAAGLAGSVSSPYILVQGWIGFLGQNGGLPRIFPGIHFVTFIYSEAGVVAFLTLLHLPIATLLVVLDGRNFPRSFLDTAKLLRFRGWKFLRHVEVPRFGLGVTAAGVWTFLLAFWSYDIPSALRQNVFSGELLAAFGAFFDYARAASLVGPLVAGGLIIAALATWPTARIVSQASRGQMSQPQQFSLSLFCLIWIVPLFLLVLPSLGLVFEIPSWQVFSHTLFSASEDIWNTVRNGLLTALVVTGLSFAAGSLLYGSSAMRLAPPLLAFQFALIGLPGSLIGIGAIGLTGGLANGGETFAVLPLLLSEIATVLPFAFLLTLLIFQRLPREWQSINPLLKLPICRQIFSLLFPELRSAMLVIFLVSFALAIRETPASLLTYPPGGATLALTIDSMLHFNQPAQIASLCLAQLAILAALSVTVLIINRFFLRHAGT
jgi:ABC-type Fe3+ transport system permease subunit